MSRDIKGIYHNGKIEALEDIPYQEDKKVLIVFLDDGEDKTWNQTVETDFIMGYSDKDKEYDNL